MNYTGQKCVLCKKVFEEDDDIVVCPECGSPHHRKCYTQNGHCANEDLHIEKKEWQPSLSLIKNVEAPGIVCIHCGHKNLPIRTKCEFCGRELPKEESTENTAPDYRSTAEVQGAGVSIDTNELNSFSMPASYLGFNPDEDMGGVTLKEISQFVGTNTLYYIPIFKKMKDIGTKISFNISCFIFPTFYFANRRMWLWTLITTLCSILFNIPTIIMEMAELQMFTDGIMNFIYDNQPMFDEMIYLCGIGQWVMRLVMCLFANWIYYQYTVKKLRKIKAVSKNGIISLKTARAMGGIKPVNILLALLLTLSLATAILVGTIMSLNMMSLYT